MKNITYNIAIIGAGQLGNRHLQGLIHSKNNLRIYVIDRSDAALETARRRFSEISTKNTMTRLKASFHHKLDELPSVLDMGIIATTAEVRETIVKELLTNHQVKYLLLEKIVFQKVTDFIDINHLLNKTGVKTWVNCARRMYPFYHALRNEIRGEIVHMKVSGNNWGLACNTIHMIDLLAFLSQRSEFRFDESGLHNEIYSSKRNGFSELRGKLTILSNRGDELQLIDENSLDEYIISIAFGGVAYTVDESKKIAMLIQPDGNIREIEIKIPYQSELTGIAVDQIFDSGESSLPSYEECMKYHIPMIEAFNRQFSKISGIEITTCPIT